ncbi:MAG TPA: hypothetical protein VE951_06465 [Candidatus Angelobacter sp.]|jgi:hypothetical protein|nr:hypothetical protein [Candidatus Angelobacter sp.]
MLVPLGTPIYTKFMVGVSVMSDGSSNGGNPAVTGILVGFIESQNREMNSIRTGFLNRWSALLHPLLQNAPLATSGC